MNLSPIKTIRELCREAENAFGGQALPPLLRRTIDELREWANPDPALFRNQQVSRKTRQQDEADNLLAIGGMFKFGTLGCVVNLSLADDFYKAAQARGDRQTRTLIRALDGKQSQGATIHSLLAHRGAKKDGQEPV